MTESNGAVKEALRHVERHFEDHKRTLVELSRIPRVSAKGFPPEEVRRSAEATAEALRGAGVEHWRFPVSTPTCTATGSIVPERRPF
jgi:acetylornithine deacetylase/succinyl-diaminopimelate desuccinylase-like protein